MSGNDLFPVAVLTGRAAPTGVVWPMKRAGGDVTGEMPLFLCRRPS
jgi:hypothetical protein